MRPAPVVNTYARTQEGIPCARLFARTSIRAYVRAYMRTCAFVPASPAARSSAGVTPRAPFPPPSLPRTRHQRAIWATCMLPLFMPCVCWLALLAPPACGPSLRHVCASCVLAQFAPCVCHLRGTHMRHLPLVPPAFCPSRAAWVCHLRAPPVCPRCVPPAWHTHAPFAPPACCRSLRHRCAACVLAQFAPCVCHLRGTRSHVRTHVRCSICATCMLPQLAVRLCVAPAWQTPGPLVPVPCCPSVQHGCATCVLPLFPLCVCHLRGTHKRHSRHLRAASMCPICVPHAWNTLGPFVHPACCHSLRHVSTTCVAHT